MEGGQQKQASKQAIQKILLVKLTKHQRSHDLKSLQI